MRTRAKAQEPNDIEKLKSKEDMNISTVSSKSMKKKGNKTASGDWDEGKCTCGKRYHGNKHK